MKIKAVTTLLIVLVLSIQLTGGTGVKPEDKVKGIVFFRTMKLEELRDFYVGKVGCEIWLEQDGIYILKAGNMLFGLHGSNAADTDALITFFYDTREEVDNKYEQFRDIASGEPKENAKYRIYHFFARDPEGRMIEFQQFLHPVKDI